MLSRPTLSRFVFRGLLAVLLLASVVSAPAQRQMEALGRGVVAVNTGGGNVYVGWRLLATDPDDLAFNLYRSTNGALPVRVNAQPVTQSTNLVDSGVDTTRPLTYFVRPVLGGVEQAPSFAATLPAGTAQPYLALSLDRPAGGTTPDGVAYTYNANDCSAGDLNGDGEYELVVKWEPTNAKDNSQSGYTGNVYLDAYTLAGARLWRIDLGRNIRAGAHYTQFMVYDLDGDGRAEVACKTADGTVDSAGTVIGSAAADHRNASGYILAGPEFLTVFAGLTGRALATTDYIPARGTVANWGDGYGNRVDRFLACVAYLDGRRPSLVMCRGYYTRAVLVAWDWRDGGLRRRWTFDSDDGTPGNSAYRGEGNHNLSVADVDGDGRDEIVYGSAAIDDDGRGLYATGLHHGDALHVSDLNPARAGLEVWSCHEDVANNGGIGLSLRDVRTGQVLFSVPNTTDTGRAMAADLDPRYPGYELWGSAGGLYSATGIQLSASRPSSMNFGVWWDADLLREIFDGSNNDGGSAGAPYVDKWNWEAGTTTRLLSATGCSVNNWTKANPALIADLVGDWREEIVLRASDSSQLRVYSTTILSTNRLWTLMHDAQYRLAVAWQNTAYNQPPHPSFFLGDGAEPPPRPDVTLAGNSGSAQLINLSVRTNAGTGGDTLILGFVAQGDGTRDLLVRGIGPALIPYGIDSALRDPRLDLYGSGGWLTGNNDWSVAANADAIAATAAARGAFALPRPSQDSVLLPNLATGIYTAHVGAATGTSGVALAELYAGTGASGPRLINASARARAGSGENTLIAGFVLAGDGPRTVLVRALGPELARVGVPDVLVDPRLTVFLGATAIATNDDWANGSGATAATFAGLGAFDLTPGSKDAALLLRLPPGIYTAHATSVTGASGVALIEIYDCGD